MKNQYKLLALISFLLIGCQSTNSESIPEPTDTPSDSINVTEQPTTEQPTTEQPTTEQPTTEDVYVELESLNEVPFRLSSIQDVPHSNKKSIYKFHKGAFTLNGNTPNGKE